MAQSLSAAEQQQLTQEFLKLLEENRYNPQIMPELEKFVDVQDSNLIDNNFSIRNVNNIFACIQIDEDSKKTGVVDEKSQELVFPEFLEGMAALTAFKVSDPFVPLYMRIDQFLGETLIPRLQLIIRSLDNIHGGEIEKVSIVNEKGSASVPGTPLAASTSVVASAGGTNSTNTVFNTKTDRRLSRASEKTS